MSYSSMTTPCLLGFHIVADRIEEPSPGEISVKTGHVAELTGALVSTDRKNAPDRPVFNGRLFDLATKEQIDDRPAILRSRKAAVAWWKSVAPDAPVPEELLAGT